MKKQSTAKKSANGNKPFGVDPIVDRLMAKMSKPEAVEEVEETQEDEEIAADAPIVIDSRAAEEANELRGDGGDVPDEETEGWTPEEYAKFLADDQKAMTILQSRMAASINEQCQKAFEAMERAVAKIGPSIKESGLTVPGTLGVGSPCVYFDLGEDTRDPLPATVLKTDTNGILTLWVWGEVGPVRKTSVYRIDDTRLNSNPELRRGGCWDTVERAEKRRVDRERTRKEWNAKQAEARRKQHQDGRERREKEAPRLVELVMVQKLTVDAAIAILNDGGNHWNITYAQTHLQRAGRREVMDMPQELPAGMPAEAYETVPA